MTSHAARLPGARRQLAGLDPAGGEADRNVIAEGVEQQEWSLTTGP